MMKAKLLDHSPGRDGVGDAADHRTAKRTCHRTQLS